MIPRSKQNISISLGSRMKGKSEENFSLYKNTHVMEFLMGMYLVVVNIMMYCVLN